jgi:hypothetical protein
VAKRKNHLRTKLDGGNRYAGTGIVKPPEWEDDYKKQRGIKVHRHGMLPTDYLGKGDEGKKAFKKYCEEQSGKVKTYNINEQTPE